MNEKLEENEGEKSSFRLFCCCCCNTVVSERPYDVRVLLVDEVFQEETEGFLGGHYWLLFTYFSDFPPVSVICPNSQ